MPFSSLSVPTALVIIRQDYPVITLTTAYQIDIPTTDINDVPTTLTTSTTETITSTDYTSPLSTGTTSVSYFSSSSAPIIATSRTSSIITTSPSASPVVTTSSDTSPITSTTSGSHATSSPVHFTGGQVAGIGIGTATIGGLLAALIFWVCMRRYKHLGEERRRRSRNDEEKRTGSRVEAPLEENLLERADDSQIRKSMQDLHELIDQHCENHYHDQAVDIAQGSLEKTLIEAGYDSLSNSAPSVAEFARLLHSPNTRLLAIRQFIALVILSHVGWWSRAEVSLLPPQIAAFCQMIPPTEGQPGSEEVFEKAFTKWRYLSAFLLEPIRSNRQPPQANQHELQRAIGRNVALINSVLKPFLNPGSESQQYQERNLSAIVFQAAQLGLLLFSQQSIWVFDWEPSRREEVVNGDKPGTRVTATEVGVARKTVGRMLVVFPAIGETIYRHGSRRIRMVAAAVEVVV